MATPNLESQARTFAAEISDVLNRTVCHGVRLSAVIGPALDDGITTMVAGCGITKWKPVPSAIALTIDAKPAELFLWVAFTLQLDPEGAYLAVTRSQFGVYRDADMDNMLFHYDYERTPKNTYAAAHLQVEGSSPLSDLPVLAGEPRTELKHFHFPVGGRRFRPTIEDVIEFLASESLVRLRPDWKIVLDESRIGWERRQLRAAVRRDPEPAAGILQLLGWNVTPPK